MNSNSPLFATSPEDLELRIKTGDGEAAMQMGLICLSGLGVKQNLSQANSYFAEAKQLGVINADLFIAYIHECNEQMIKAIETYAGKETPNKKGDSVIERIGRRFKTVCSERKKLSKILKDYGLPECPLNTSLNSLLEDLASGRNTLPDICSILSSHVDGEHWCEDTALLYYEEGEWELANFWMKKSHADEKCLSLIQDKLRNETTGMLEAVEIEGASLLGRKLSINILSENGASSDKSIKRSLADWGKACNQIKKEQIRLEEERRKKEAEEKARQERLKKEAEEKARQERLKKEAEERAKNEEAIQKKKGKDTPPKAPKTSEKPQKVAPIDYHQLFNKGLFWFEESLTLRDEAILPYMDIISRDVKKRDVKAITLKGYHFYLQQDYGKALTLYQDALSALQKNASTNDAIAEAGLCFDIAQVLLQQGSTMTALGSFENCLKILDKSNGDTSEEKAMVYYHMGRVRNGMGHTRIRLECLNSALSILEKDRTKHALGIGIIYDQLALWNSQPSSYNDALKFHFKALKSFQLLEEGTLKSSKIIECNDHIGGVYYLLGDYPKALEYYSLAKNKRRINQLSEIVNYGEKDKKVKCSYDRSSVYYSNVEFTFSFDSAFNDSSKLVAKCYFLYQGIDIPIKRIKNNKVTFSIPEYPIRQNKYFTLEIEIYRLFKSKIEDADKLDYYLLDSKKFNFSRQRRFFFFGRVESVSREY